MKHTLYPKDRSCIVDRVGSVWRFNHCSYALWMRWAFVSFFLGYSTICWTLKKQGKSSSDTEPMLFVLFFSLLKCLLNKSNEETKQNKKKHNVISFRLFLIWRDSIIYNYIYSNLYLSFCTCRQRSHVNFTCTRSLILFKL